MSPETKKAIIHAALDFASRLISVFLAVLFAGVMLILISGAYNDWRMESRLQHARENIFPLKK